MTGAGRGFSCPLPPNTKAKVHARDKYDPNKALPDLVTRLVIIMIMIIHIKSHTDKLENYITKGVTAGQSTANLRRNYILADLLNLSELEKLQSFKSFFSKAYK